MWQTFNTVSMWNTSQAGHKYGFDQKLDCPHSLSIPSNYRGINWWERERARERVRVFFFQIFYDIFLHFSDPNIENESLLHPTGRVLCFILVTYRFLELMIPNDEIESFMRELCKFWSIFLNLCDFRSSFRYFSFIFISF